MPRDNVTPFQRPPRRPQPKPSGGLGLSTHRGKAVLVHVLALACFATPFFVGGTLGQFASLGLGIAAGVIAFTNRAEAMPWAATHHEHVFRTVLFGFIITTVLSLPGLIIPPSLMPGVLQGYFVIAFWLGLALLAWVLVRSGVGLVLAIIRQPIGRPRGWLL